MSFHWEETDESRKRAEGFAPTDNKVELQYAGWGSRDDREAEAALQAILPIVFRGLPLRTWRYDPAGADNWTATANYHARERPEPPEMGDVTFACDTTGGTTHVTQAISQTTYGPSGKLATDPFEGAIGVGRNRAVEGVGITIPALKFQLTYNMPNTMLTLGYVLILYELTGGLNAKTFKGFAPGELLFLGATATQRTTANPSGLLISSQIGYHFAASKNKTDIPIGSTITVTRKRGHDYLWVQYKDVDNDGIKELVPNPDFASVAVVYEDADFGRLAIGA